MCEYFLASQQALRLNIAVGGRDQARTTIPKLTISNLHVHSEILNCHEQDKQTGAVSDLRHMYVTHK